MTGLSRHPLSAPVPALRARAAAASRLADTLEGQAQKAGGE
jgi:hypothetical protein